MDKIHNLGERIFKLRKKKGYTQEKLSALLYVTPQAVSKWEVEHGFPEISLLPKLAGIFEISLDELLTGNPYLEKVSPYDAVYGQKAYYWGQKQSVLAEKAAQYLLENGKRKAKVLDLGSGEGRDAIYFAKCGFSVDALEISAPGIDKIKAYALLAGCKIHTIHETMIGYDPVQSYDFIYSMGALQFLPPEQRDVHFAYYKSRTHQGGINAHLIFVKKPFIEMAPDWQKNEYFYQSGDLARQYHDWNILFEEEKIIECSSSGILHQHAVACILAEKKI